MSDTDYKKALQRARTELEKLFGERSEIDRRITLLKRSIESLSELSGENKLINEISDFFEAKGLTHAIRRSLSKSSAALSPPEIRDLIKKSDSNWNPANPLTSIHNTLKRLEKQGEVIQTDNGWILKEKFEK